MKRAMAVLAALSVLWFSPVVSAGPKELTDYVRKLLESAELPQTADDAAIEIVDNGKLLRLSGKELKAAMAAQARLTTENFKVDSVNCRPQTCSIHYEFRASLKFNGKEVSQYIQSDEEYRVDANGFVMIRARQIQKNEERL